MASETSFHLVFLHGLPGVGKLTTGKVLTTKYLPTYKLLHNHMIMEPLKSFFQFASPPFVKLRELHWLQLLEESFKYKLEKKSEYVNDCNSKIDGIIFTFPFEYSISKEFLFNVMDLTHKYQNVTVTFIELVCNEQTLLKRVINKDRQKNGKLTDANILKQYIENGKLYSGRAYIEHTLNQSNIQINTEGKSIDEVAQLVHDKIQQSIQPKTTKKIASKLLVKLTRKQLLIAGFHRYTPYIGDIPYEICELILKCCGIMVDVLEIGDVIDYKPKHGWKVATIKDIDVLVLKKLNVILVAYDGMCTGLNETNWIVLHIGKNAICDCVGRCNEWNHVIAEANTQSVIETTIDEVD